MEFMNIEIMKINNYFRKEKAVQTNGHFLRYIKYVDKEGIERKEKNIIFSSGEPGTKIKNAITGCYYPNYIVGTKDEYLLYKVRLYKAEHPYVFFFDSPEQYEKSQHTTVPSKKKIEWFERKAKEFDKKYNQNKNENTIGKE